MGFFSGKTKYYVSASVIDLNTTPSNMVADAAIKAAVGDDIDMTTQVRAALLNGFHNKLSNAWLYAMRDYYYGVPTFEYANRLDDVVPLVDSTLEEYWGYPISASSAYITKGDYITEVWEYICGAWDYDPMGNLFRRPFATFTGTDPNVSPFQLENVTFDGDATFTITGYYMYGTGSIERHSINYYREPLVSYGDMYYHVIYFNIINDPASPIYGGIIPQKIGWIYRIKDNTYPELGGLNLQENTHPFLPVVPLRSYNTDLTENKESEGYQTSKKLLNILSLNIDDVAEQLNKSPDIGKIDHAYILFGTNIADILDPNKRIPGSVHYLYKFLVYGRGLSNTNNRTWEVVYSDTNEAYYSLHIRNAGLDFTVAWDHLIYDHIEGVIGIPDTVTTEYGVHGTTNGWYRSSVTFKHQISKDYYVKVSLFNLRHIQVVQNRTITTNIADAVWGDDKNFIIPLDKKFLAEMNLREQDALALGSFKLLCQSWEAVSTGFFGSMFFKVIMMIIIVVLFIWTAGQSTWLAAFVELATSSLFGFLAAVAIMIIVKYVVTYAVRLLVEQIGGELALVLAAILAAVLAITGNLDATWDIFVVFEQTIAVSLVDVISAVIVAVQQITMEAMEELRDDATEFGVAVGNRKKELEAVQAELTKGNLLEPIRLLDDRFATPIFPVESPDAFYERTIHTQNIGVLSLDMIGSFYDIALTLPDKNKM